VHESPQFKEFQALHARQPGYEGSFVIDAGDCCMFSLTLWQTAHHAAAARVVLEPVVRRALNPLMTAPSRLLGTGPVVVKDVVEAITQPV
jgi:hypothetical protein